MVRYAHTTHMVKKKNPSAVSYLIMSTLSTICQHVHKKERGLSIFWGNHHTGAWSIMFHHALTYAKHHLQNGCIMF